MDLLPENKVIKISGGFRFIHASGSGKLGVKDGGMIPMWIKVRSVHSKKTPVGSCSQKHEGGHRD